MRETPILRGMDSTMKTSLRRVDYRDINMHLNSFEFLVRVHA